MQIFWWDSLIQSVGTEFFLKLRQSAAFSRSRLTRRLDLSESSTGENSSFSDNWIRAHPSDFLALKKALTKSKEESALVFDLVGLSIQGVRFENHIQELTEVLAAADVAICLFPKFDYGGICDFIEDEPSLAKHSDGILEQLRVMKTNYEVLLNISADYVLVDCIVPFNDFRNTLSLDFSKTNRILGLFNVVPRDLTAGKLAFGSQSEISEKLFSILEKFVNHQSYSRFLPLNQFELRTFESSKKSLLRNGYLSRRSDGTLALKVGWKKFSKYTTPVGVHSSKASSASNDSVEYNQMSAVLSLLARFEAHRAMSLGLKGIEPSSTVPPLAHA